MAEKYWLGGSGSGDARFTWTTVGNWSGGSLPVDGDDVYFDGRANVDPTDSTKKCKCTIFTGMTIRNFASFNVRPEFTGAIGDGTTDGWLKIRCESTDSATFDVRQICFEGVAACYIKIDGNLHHVERILCKGSSSSILNLISLNLGTTTGGGFRLIEAASGLINIEAASVVTKLIVSDNATLIAKNGIVGDSVSSPPATDILQANGVVTWCSDFRNADIVGGVFNWGSSNDTTLGGSRRHYGLLQIFRGAIFNWQARDQVAASGNYPATTSTLKAFRVHPYGVLNAAGTINAGYLKQIGATLASAGTPDISDVMAGGQALFDNGTKNITMLTGAKLRNRGGLIGFPSYSDWSW